MPIYEYACEVCGHEFEKLTRIGASPPPCPNCEANDVKKLISATSFVLKGSGWYKDHYGLKSSGSSDGGDKGGSSSGGSSSGGSSSSGSSSGGSSSGGSSSGDSGSSASAAA